MTSCRCRRLRYAAIAYLSTGVAVRCNVMMRQLTGLGFNPYAYNITVRECAFDGESLFEARVKELPDVREYAESAREAYDLAIDTIETAAGMFAEAGRLFPLPASPQDQFSGRVTLRLPKSLHRALASAAEDEGVSLNQHLVTALACHMRNVPATPPNQQKTP